jgi:hypothetical protein
MLIRLANPFGELRYISVVRLAPVLLVSATLILIVASPAVPELGLIFSQPNPVVSILHESLQLKLIVFALPVEAIVSVWFDKLISGDVCLLQEKSCKRIIKPPAIIKVDLLFMLFVDRLFYTVTCYFILTTLTLSKPA